MDAVICRQRNFERNAILAMWVFHFRQTSATRNLQRGYVINPPYLVRVATLPCKIVIAIFVIFSTSRQWYVC